MAEESARPREFSIENCDDVRSAVAKHEEWDKAEERLIIKKAIDLGCVDAIPDDWAVEVENG